MQAFLDYISQHKSIRSLRTFLGEFCQMDLRVLDSDGKLSNAAPAYRDPLYTSGREWLSLHPAQEVETERCRHMFYVDPALLHDAKLHREPRAFVCHFLKRHKIIFPLIIQKQALGFLFGYENGRMPVKESQIATILLLIGEMLEKIQLDELFRQWNRCRNLTHQQLVVEKAIQYLQGHYARSSLSLHDVAAWLWL